MTIHNISICRCGNALSGGEKFTDEVVSRWAKKYPSVNYFGWSQSSVEPGVCGIRTVNILKDNPSLGDRFKILVRYFIIIFKSLKFVKKFDTEKNIIVSHFDAWPNMLFAFLLKLANPTAYWIAVTHNLVFPNPFLRQHIYIKKFRIPNFFEVYQWLNQKLFFLMQKKADLLACGNATNREELLKKNANLHVIRYGREYFGEPETSMENKLYDICFLGRFHTQKGTDEIPDILRRLKKSHDQKLSVIFIAPKESPKKGDYLGWLEKEIAEIGYDFKFLGPKYGVEKYNFLKKSKILLFPSFFESFGLVYLDAISVGTPVVEYDLPCYDTHRAGVLKASFRDNEAFAQNLKRLLIDQELYKIKSLEGYNYSKTFDWDITANGFESYFEDYCDR
ncbi:MAG: Glycosyltransferase [Candidatus Falkowbacteria bacterium GW2011_GWF2_43_32]|nr:MAG: Glycosyltransferase [Candidatus Falkowbacteria bacterium GW2011_GWF2_43_32]